MSASGDGSNDGAGSSIEAPPPVPGTPSWLTGEFYAAITPAVVAVIGAVTGAHVVPGSVERELVAFGTVAVTVYAVARTALKAAHVHAAAKVAAAQAMSAAAVARTTAPPAQVLTHGDADRLADALDRRFVLRHRQPVRKS